MNSLSTPQNNELSDFKMSLLDILNAIGPDVGYDRENYKLGNILLINQYIIDDYKFDYQVVNDVIMGYDMNKNIKLLDVEHTPTSTIIKTSEPVTINGWLLIKE